MLIPNNLNRSTLIYKETASFKAKTSTTRNLISKEKSHEFSFSKRIFPKSNSSQTRCGT